MYAYPCNILFNVSVQSVSNFSQFFQRACSLVCSRPSCVRVIFRVISLRTRSNALVHFFTYDQNKINLDVRVDSSFTSQPPSLAVLATLSLNQPLVPCAFLLSLRFSRSYRALYATESIPNKLNAKFITYHLKVHLHLLSR